MNETIFNTDHILFDDSASTQDEAFAVIAALAYEHGYVRDQQAYYLGLKAREQETTTGFKDHIAIPHSKDATVKKAGMFLVKFAQPIPWNALDGKAIHVAFALTIPLEGADLHLQMLGQIARQLIDDDFRTGVLQARDKETLGEIMRAIAF